jgi:zinc transport system ATP-binding protein
MGFTVPGVAILYPLAPTPAARLPPVGQRTPTVEIPDASRCQHRIPQTPADFRVSEQTLLEASGLGYQAGGQMILEHISLRLRAGEILTVIGPNGAGKTTLLKLLIGLLEPTAGTVSRRPGLRIGYMPQRLAIDPALPMSVARFLQIAERRPDRVADVAEETGIGHLLDSALASVSGGEFQRALLARALLRRPELLVLDEPVQGVDVLGQADLYALIKEVRTRHHCAVLMISHDLHLVMAATDTVLCLNRHVCCAGQPEDVSAHPAYLQLFGRQAAGEIAVYTHHHDHAHDLHGDVIDGHRHG